MCCWQCAADASVGVLLAAHRATAHFCSLRWHGQTKYWTGPPLTSEDSEAGLTWTTSNSDSGSRLSREADSDHLKPEASLTRSLEMGDDPKGTTQPRSLGLHWGAACHGTPAWQAVYKNNMTMTARSSLWRSTSSALYFWPRLGRPRLTNFNLKLKNNVGMAGCSGCSKTGRRKLWNLKVNANGFAGG